MTQKRESLYAYIERADRERMALHAALLDECERDDEDGTGPCPECGHTDGSQPNPDIPMPRWDEDKTVRRFGWLAGRCGRCGADLSVPHPT